MQPLLPPGTPSDTHTVKFSGKLIVDMFGIGRKIR
uniref:Uncharacterized protein n=1 Tax=Anopheles christyi TaxID=43041 RepID=A0A182KI05_9DIPT